MLSIALLRLESSSSSLSSLPLARYSTDMLRRWIFPFVRSRCNLCHALKYHTLLLICSASAVPLHFYSLRGIWVIILHQTREQENALLSLGATSEWCLSASAADT